MSNIADTRSRRVRCGDLRSEGIELSNGPMEKAANGFVAKVCEENHESLVNFLRGRLGSHQDANDVAQEAYAKLLNLEQVEVIRQPCAFLFKVASNLAIDLLRQRGRLKEATGASERGENVPCPYPSPEDVLDAKKKVEWLRQIIAELPPKCRMAFMLYKFEELEYAEIAGRMNLTESMVRKYVLRAVVYCRERMGPILIK